MKTWNMILASVIIEPYEAMFDLIHHKDSLELPPLSIC